MASVTPDIPEIFQEAYERAGLDMKTGYDLSTQHATSTKELRVQLYNYLVLLNPI